MTDKNNPILCIGQKSFLSDHFIKLEIKQKYTEMVAMASGLFFKDKEVSWRRQEVSHNAELVTLTSGILFKDRRVLEVQTISGDCRENGCSGWC